MSTHFPTFREVRGQILFLILMAVSGLNGEVAHVVRTGKNLNQIAQDLTNTVEKGLHTVSFSTYRNVGIFALDSASSSLADTIHFKRESQSDSVIEVGAGAPLIRIRNWKGVLRISNLAFRLSSPSAILVDGYDVASPLGTLILDSCLIFADEMSSNALRWLSEPAKRIEIFRSHIVANRGRNAVLTLEAPVVRFYNNVLNFSGYLQTKASADFSFISNNTCRMQLDANGNFRSANYRVAGNLVAHPPGQNYLGSPTAAKFFLGLTNFKDSGSFLRDNHIYRGTGGPSNWAGFELVSNNALFTGSVGNDSIPPYSQPDTTELWNWGLTGDLAHGALSGDSARPNAYNVFPGETAKATRLPDSVGATVYFQASVIPRTLDPKFSGALPPTGAAVASMRFMWPGMQALAAGGPFRIDSLRLRGTARDGNPVLLAKLDTGSFAAQAEGVMRELDTTILFVNGRANATQFHAAFRCNTPTGQLVTPRNEMGYADTLDTLQFGIVDRAGRTLWAISSPPDSTLPLNLRYLNRTVSFTTTAVLGSSSTIRLGSRKFTAPFLPDSVKWRNSLGGTLHAVDPASPVLMGTIPAATPFAAHLVERLSVPRGKQTASFRFAWGRAKAQSEAGFQIRLDSSKTVDTTQFGYRVKPCAVIWRGRGARDSVWMEMKVPDTLELWKLPSSGLPTRVTSALRRGDTLALPLAITDTGAHYFSGLRLNIPANTPFNGLVGGFQIDSLRSQTAGLLTVDSLKAADADTVLEARNTLFLAGASISSRLLRIQGTYGMRFTIPKPLDTANVKAWVYVAGQGWRPHASFALLTGATSLRVTDLDSNMARVLVVETIGMPQGVIANHALHSTANGLHTLLFSNGGSAGRITHFTVEAVSVSLGGLVSATPQISPRTEFSAAVNLIVAAQAYHSFTFRYFIGDTLAGINPIGVLSYLKVEISSQEALAAPTLPRGWQLAGLPMDGKLMARFETLSASKDTVDKRQCWRLEKNGNTYAWDSVRSPDTLNLARGFGILFGGTRSYRIQLEQAIHPDLKPFKIAGAEGWLLISNPFPFPLKLDKVSSNRGSLSLLRRLVAVAGQTPGSRTYSWPGISGTEEIKPFTGYAYFFRAGEELTIDPLARATLAKTGVTETLVLRAGLQGLSAEASLARGGEEIPILPAAGESFDLRLGPGSGMWHKIVNLEKFEVALIVTSPIPGQADLSFRTQGWRGVVPELALWDSLSGKVYSGEDLNQVTLSKGENRFILIGGAGDFVRDRMGRLRAYLPGTARISVWGNTREGLRLRLQLPARTGGYDRMEVVVHDAKGRRVLSRVFGRFPAGEREYAFPFQGVGLYFCRVRVFSEGPVFSVARKVLVAP